MRQRPRDTAPTSLRAAAGWRALWCAAAVAAGTVAGARAAADQLVVPAAVPRHGTLQAEYRFAQPTSGHGTLAVTWSDADGRLVEQRQIPLALDAAASVSVTLDLRRAVALHNRLTAHLSLEPAGDAGNRREAAAAATFIATPAGRPWSNYQIIMWQPQSAAGYRALQTIGVAAGELHGDRSDQPELHIAGELDPLLAADMPFYVENIATDLYASYHRWSGDRPVNWRFLAAKERHRANPRDLEAFFRDPSLSNRAFLAKIERRLQHHVQALRAYRPLYYCLGDETGIADLAAAWDFDLSPASLAGMRAWLKERYGSLAALNREWGSDFAGWVDVVPMLTDQALARTDGNYAAWGDFKEWMDVAFARALKAGTDAVHAADPQALAAIEGAQIPGWGGYDYTRLAHAVDAMEIYDFADNVEMVRSFNPHLVLLTTSFRSGPDEQHRVWRELLRGVGGLILWDPDHQVVGADGAIGPRGRAAAPYFRELRDGLGAVLLAGERHLDPIGILYSQPSLRVQWLLDRKASREDWTRRSAGTEYQDNAIRLSIRNYVGAIEHMGLQPRFVSGEQLAAGALRHGGYRVLILPQAIALSAQAGAALREFLAQGGLVIADGLPGRFDEHGRRLDPSPLADLFAPAGNPAAGGGRAIRLSSPDAPDSPNGRLLRGMFAAAGIAPRFPLAHRDGTAVTDVETYSFDDGGVTILALLRDLPKAAGNGGGAPAVTESVIVSLPQRRYVYDMRAHRVLGATDRLTLDLDATAPTILALSDKAPAPPTLTAPAAARLGGNAQIGVQLHTAAARDVVHVAVIDPAGETVLRYSGNIAADGGKAAAVVPFALNDAAGAWTIRATDPLSGSAEARIDVKP